MASQTNRQDPNRPTQDEWGLYDPNKAGLSALFNRLDLQPALTDSESGIRTRVLNMSGVRKPSSAIPGGRSIL
jgi:hypothetical protein